MRKKDLMSAMVVVEGSGKNGLVNALKEAMANAVVLNFSAQRAHWNVTGPDFFQYHALFAEIYEDIYGSIDPLAENIRKMRSFPPSLGEMISLASISDDTKVTGARELASDLMLKNSGMIQLLKDVFTVADDANEQGIADFIAGRIDMHEKWDWQLRSSLG
jgi:starvation-inducible DNA-binding protein